MTELLTAAQMRAVEGAAIERGDVTGLELMERAGRGVVEAVLAEWPDLAAAPGRAVVLCGPGNNGGDGFVVARLLKERGWELRVCLLGKADTLPPDARANHDRWCALGRVEPLSEESLGTVSDPPGLVVDALFGTGLTRPVEGVADFVLANVAPLRAEFSTRCVAVDIPSGICADSGRALGGFAPADLTVSFHAEKLGHCLAGAERHSRRVAVAQIGLPHEPERAHVRKVDAPAPARLAKTVEGQKYDHGHAVIVSGPGGHSGAARLAARGVLRIGAGLVTLAVPPSARAEVAAQITALMLREITDAEALSELLWDTRLNALCLGPGLGLDDRARGLVEAVLPLGRAVVLDADALTLISRDAALFARLHDRCVLTPHGGEFGRLFPEIAKRLEAAPARGPAYSRVDAVRAAARRAGCVVLLKGADTVIAAPDGRCAVHAAIRDRAAPWLATAGAGDVLAGMIAGLLARGVDQMEAAETAAWLHVEAARRFGPGLIAEDLPETLPGVFSALGA